MSHLKSGTPAYRRANAALIGGALVTFAVLYSVQPVLPALARHFEVTPTVASLALSTTTATLAVCLLLAAVLSDALGRKRVMAGSLVATSLLSILAALSTDFTTLLALRALQGIALAGLPAIAMAYVSEEFEPGTVGTVMGLYISGTALGGMGGRIVAGNLAGLLSWQAAFAVIGTVSLGISLAFAALLPRERRFRPRPIRLGALGAAFLRHLRSPPLLGLFAMAFLLMGSFVTLYNYVTFHLQSPPYGLSQAVVGWIFAVYLTGTVSAAATGRLADRFGRERVLPVAVLVMIAGGAMTLAPGLGVIIAGIAIYTFGFFGAHSVASGWIGPLAGRDRAQASSLYLLFYYLGSSVMGTAGGLFWLRWGWPGIAVMLAPPLLACLGLSLLPGRGRYAGATLRVNEEES